MAEISDNIDFIELYNTHTNKINKEVVGVVNNLTQGFDVEFIHVKQRLWHLIHNIKTTPVCPVCNEQMRKWSKHSQSYSETCGYACSAKRTSADPAIRAKRASTNMERYGSTTPAKNQLIKDKANATKIDRYGSYSGEVWREKVKQGCMDSLGVDNPSRLQSINDKKSQTWSEKSADDIKQITESRQHTMIERFGVDNPSKDAATKAKALSTNIERYGGPSPKSSPDIRERIYTTNMERYGAPNPAQNTMVREKISATNREARGGIHNAQQHLPADTLEKLNSYEWLVEQHHVNKFSPTHIARKMLGVTEATVFRYMARHGISHQHFPHSSGEREISEWLDHELGLTLVLNNRTILNGKELDIFIPSHNLAIEYCGLYWHSNAHDRITPSYHKHKMEACNKAGIRLLTIFEDEWVSKSEVVKHTLQYILNATHSQSVGARRTTVHQLSTYEKNDFFDTYHIQGSGPGSITYGLKHNNQIVAAMTFINKSINAYELNRYATSCSVPGGFSKLLSHFKQQHSDWEEIVSFADLRWSEGSMYKKNQFMLDKTLPPDYYWVVDGDRQHKFAWRHGNRLSKLPEYDSMLSESQNMLKHGYFKIYNCGLQRWVQRNGQ